MGMQLELDPLEPILVATQRTDAAVKQDRVYWIDAQAVGPPFYSLSRLRAVVCPGLFTLNLTGTPAGGGPVAPPGGQRARRRRKSHSHSSGSAYAWSQELCPTPSYSV